MHCFATRVRTSLTHHPELVLLADAFFQYESDMCKEGLLRDTLPRPCLPLLWVALFLADGTEMKSIFYYDMKDEPKKDPKDVTKKDSKGAKKAPKAIDTSKDPLVSKINQVFQLPKNFTAKITYQGLCTETGPADPSSGKELSSLDDFVALKLDTRYTHLIHVNEWKILVQISTFTEKVEKEFTSSDTSDAVLKYVELQTGNANLHLYHEKNQMKKSDSIGSVCKGSECHLVACDPSSAEQRAKLLS